jgi:opacity protein-like surface antigen
MRRFTLAAGLLAALAASAQAKDMQFWNETSKEFTGVYLAPAGTTQWGPNQTDNDDDHAVSADERLKVTGVAPGRYDVKLVEKSGRICIVRGVEAKATGKVAFSIAERQLTDCTR